MQVLYMTGRCREKRPVRSRHLLLRVTVMPLVGSHCGPERGPVSGEIPEPYVLLKHEREALLQAKRVLRPTMLLVIRCSGLSTAIGKSGWAAW
jgi:hypothetical protein